MRHEHRIWFSKLYDMVCYFIDSPLPFSRKHTLSFRMPQFQWIKGIKVLIQPQCYAIEHQQRQLLETSYTVLVLYHKNCHDSHS